MQYYSYLTGDARVVHIVQCLPNKVVSIFEAPFNTLGSNHGIQPGIAGWESTKGIVNKELEFKNVARTHVFPSITSDLMA
jgi:hypothetical protein